MSEADAFLARVEQIAESQNLQPLEAALVVSVGEGVARDTRAFAKIFGVAHALALRAVSEIDGHLVLITSRDPRTQRTRLTLTDAGRALVAS